MTFQQFSPFKRIGDQIQHCRKIGQDQPRVIIYINFVELESPILHVKSQDHRTSGSGEKHYSTIIGFNIYGHDGHFVHVTWTVYIRFCSSFPGKLHMKFGFDWSTGFREDL